MKECDNTKLRVINIGLQSFFDAIESQSCKVVQLAWMPPVEINPEIQALLDKLL